MHENGVVVMNTAAGHKAYDTRIAKFGPDEQRRAGQMAKHRKETGCAPAQNPYARENFYPVTELARGDQFDAWAKANPDRCHSENPYRWM